jgi:hypothetical protein
VENWYHANLRVGLDASIAQSAIRRFYSTTREPPSVRIRRARALGTIFTKRSNRSSRSRSATTPSGTLFRRSLSG